VVTRKASANILAVEERQSLEALSRDLKTCRRALTQIKEKYEAFGQRRDKLETDESEASERKDEVSVFF
jgi:structural maintenance of chromosome 1